jgi:hypothetical protein
MEPTQRQPCLMRFAPPQVIRGATPWTWKAPQERGHPTSYPAIHNNTPATWTGVKAGICGWLNGWG